MSCDKKTPRETREAKNEKMPRVGKRRFERAQNAVPAALPILPLEHDMSRASSMHNKSFVQTATLP